MASDQVGARGGLGAATLNVSVPRAEQRSRAAALLGPASPGRLGDDCAAVHRAGGGIGPDQADKLFRKLDRERIRGSVTLVTVDERDEPVAAPREPAAALWGTGALAGVPADWSDLLCELQLTSSDHLARGALLTAPINPTRVPGRSAFRFRVARRFGYGASPQMTRRCLERLDADGIAGTLTVLHVLSDTHNVATQGPVWRVSGKAV